mmetsp:Transcript_31207/g.80103  ORF Transcript_31207/g.80103 Transcript_31207/m.80103 type:complete len:316 (+) Transcript_31207:553-1500(+)|eukprot:jgi/Tetstr1/437294/TSEL_002778.t1
MAKRPQQQPLVCHGHSRPIVEVNYTPVTPDGYFLVSASKDGNPMVRNGENGDWIGTFQGHKGAVWSAHLNSPGLLAATASADFSMRVWDALSGDELHQFQHKHIVRTTQFAADNYRLLTGGREKILRIFDVNQPNAEPLQMTGVTAGIRCATWCKNDSLIITACSDQPNLSVWDVRTASIVRTIETEAPPMSLDTTSDGNILTIAEGSSVKFIDLNSLSVIKSFATEHATETAALSLDKNRFCYGGEDMWVYLCDYTTGENLETLRGHHGPVHSVKFAPGGETFASGSEDGTIRLWKTESTEEDGVDGAEAPSTQ